MFLFIYFLILFKVVHAAVLSGADFRCMRKFGSDNLIPLDSEIEQTCWLNRKDERTASSFSQDTMVEPTEEVVQNNRALRDYAMPIVDETFSGI